MFMAMRNNKIPAESSISGLEAKANQMWEI